LRSASNVYFGVVRSAIYLPRASNVPDALLEILSEPLIRGMIHMTVQSGGTVDPGIIRGNQRELLEPYSDEQLQAAIDTFATEDREVPPASSNSLVADESRETAFRRDEYRVLCEGMESDQLTVRSAPLDRYIGRMSGLLERVLLIDRLRETRALTGFNRVFAEKGVDDADRFHQLWKSVPDWTQRWLPAYRVFGEGIFLELNLAALGEWEALPSVRQRAALVNRRYEVAREARSLEPREISARFLAVHTFSHLLINQLTFDCGYSSSALRERLYVSANPAEPMAGVLIYTATGDSEGTMGGLVRMGRPGYLEGVIESALQSAAWCSADPVCMEAGTSGQGPDSCNLAACHNCSLLPETACEEFNRFLDRALVIGSLEDPTLGFQPAVGMSRRSIGSLEESS
jgi:hypothetical protein